MKLGSRSTYTVRTGFGASVAPIRMSRALSVAGVPGYETEGPLGRSRLAWFGGELLAERFVGARFVPPITILVRNEKEAQRKWKGRFESPEGVHQAEARLEQSAAKFRIGSKQFDAVKTRLQVWWPGHRSEVLSWYADGTGLLRQEQRTDGELKVSLELLSPGG